MSDDKCNLQIIFLISVYQTEGLGKKWTHTLNSIFFTFSSWFSTYTCDLSAKFGTDLIGKGTVSCDTRGMFFFPYYNPALVKIWNINTSLHKMKSITNIQTIKFLKIPTVGHVTAHKQTGWLAVANYRRLLVNKQSTQSQSGCLFLSQISREQGKQ
jgi:hypothetical protein